MCICEARLVNTISQESNDGNFSYLEYVIIIPRERSLVFAVEVKVM